MKRKAGILGTTICALVTAMCSGSPTSPTPPVGGGGGGGGGQTGYTASGRFLDPRDNAGYNGTVMFGGVPGQTQGGAWTAQNINSGRDIIVAFPANGEHLEGKTKVNASAGPNTYDDFYGFPNDPVLLAIFDSTGRRSDSTFSGEGPSYRGGTIKWAEYDENGNLLPPPRIHVDDQTVLPILSRFSTHRGTRYTDILNRTLSEYIPQAYSYFRDAVVIRHPTSATLPADGAQRTFIIKADPVQPPPGFGGANLVYVNRKNNVYSCTFVIFPNISGDIIVQDSINCASGLVHDNVAYQESIRSFYNENRNRPEPEDGLPLVDRVLGEIQRKMRAGTRSPWDDSHLDAIDPRSVANTISKLIGAEKYNLARSLHLNLEKP